MTTQTHVRAAVVLAVISCLFPVICVWAQASLKLDEEFEFASGLVDLGFPDFADKVVQNVLRVHPDQKDRAQLIQAQILIARRKFEDAEKIIQAMGMESPKAQAIGLALARAYYAIGETDKARTLYSDFFKRYEGRIPTDPDLLRFYQEACYQYGQMLESSGDMVGAISAYGRILGTQADRGTKRRIQAMQAELYVKAADKDSGKRDQYLNEAKKICEQIQWGGIDVWFGQSLVAMAHAELVKGDRVAAEKVITSNLDILKEIDQALKEAGETPAVSPMAGARYLLGEIFQANAEQMEKRGAAPAEVVEMYGKALSEFYNVFAKYGESEWGQRASVKAGNLKNLLETRYNKQVKIDLGGKVKQAAAAYFRLPDTLFRRREYKQAVEEYIKALNQFPETDHTGIVLGNMMEAYAELDDPLMVKMLIAYAGERFAGRDDVAMNALLRIGKYYFDRKNEPMYMLAYDTYLKYFPKHERAGAVLFTLAGLKKAQGDEAAANALLERIVKEYPRDPNYAKALSSMAWGYFASSNFEKAVEGFRVYIKEAQPSPAKAQAQNALAESLRQLGRYAEAAAEYEVLISWLAPKNNPYATSAEDEVKNQKLLERAVFQRASCYARATEPPESVPEYRQRAIKVYDQFLAFFPKSDLAPKAMSGKGAVLMALGQYDAAAKTYEELAQKYPNSDEGRGALYAMAKSAMEINLYDQAKGALDKMIADAKSYKPEQFFRIGQMMFEAKLYPQAVKAFEQVRSATVDRVMLEPALYGMGQAYYEMKDFSKAVEVLEDMVKRYPMSKLAYQAKFTLGRAYRELDQPAKAIAALTDVYKYADTPVLLNQASYDLGLVQKQQGDLAGALASFLRIGLLADPKNPELRPLIQKSLLESIDLGMQLGRYDDVNDSCDLFLKLFPTGDQAARVRESKAQARIKAVQSESTGSETNEMAKP